MKPLKRGDIRSECGNTYYTRGLGYYNTGRVLEISDIESDADGDSITFKAKVGGSRGTPYRQEIAIEWFGDEVSIEGHCSCPMTYNCKHVAAACLKFIDVAGNWLNPSPSVALGWLSELVEAGGEKEEAPGPRDDFLVYLLQPGSAPGRIRIEYRLLRTKKHGGLTKPRKVQYYRLTSSYNRPRYLTAEDVDIINLLEVSRGDVWNYHPVQGATGGIALLRMLATGRCYWREAEEGAALEWSDEIRPLALSWQREQDGGLHLEVGVQPPGLILLVEPPFYLDPKTHAVGALDIGAFTTGQLAKLLAAPTLNEKVAATFSRELLLRYPDLAIPPPVELETREIGGVAPVPVLDLFRTPMEGGEIHVMRIGFDYQGYRVAPLPLMEQVTLEEAGGLVRIARELEQEVQALQRLEAWGCEPLVDQDSGDVAFYVPGDGTLLDSVARWKRMVEEYLPQLEREGWRIQYDASFQLGFYEADAWWGELAEEGDGGWFSMSLDVEVEGRRMPLLPLLGPVLEAYEPDDLPETVHVPLGKHQYLAVPGERIRPWIQTIVELFDREPPQGEALRMSRFDAARVAELEDNSNVAWRGGERLRSLGRRLRDFKRIEPVDPPPAFNGELRDYQKKGYDWLHFLHDYELGGILADDMGLGKTVQTLAFLASQKARGGLSGPALVIAPTSLMGNWQREAAQFTPTLKVLLLHGPGRRRHFQHIGAHDLVLTTYPLLPRDHEALLEQRYSILVLDEAQVVKNPKSQAAQVVRRIKADQRLCLTGTPMENHLGELWTQFDFLMPGFLGDQKSFSRLYRTPIEKNGDTGVQARLARRVAPFMLRRRKDEVEKDLPKKTEIVRNVPLGKAQAGLYESIRLTMEKKVRDAVASKGLARSHITILDALLKLRQVCCDPRLVKLKAAAKVKQSAKLEMLMGLLPEMLEEGRRILLFSQFTTMIGLIEKELGARNIRYSKLTGQTRKRDEAIRRFTQGEADVFLISLKAGGVGLNLTAADTVILYDPWWNPAAESQAMDRAHRIGQDKPVFVYKLLTEGTVEERILALQEKKKALAESVYRKGKGASYQLTDEDLNVLFEPLTEG